MKTNVADKNKSGVTALLSATKGGHLAVVHCLIEHGANVYDAYTDGTTALGLAKKLGHSAIEDYLKSTQVKIETEEIQSARRCYEEKQYDKAVRLFYSLAQRDVPEAKQKLDEIIKHPALEECQTLIIITNQNLKQAPENRDHQFLLADIQAEQGLSKIKDIKMRLKQHEVEKKSSLQQQQMTHKIDELAQLVKSNTLDASNLELRFNSLEQQALTVKTIEFYITRGSFYFELASNETDKVRRNVFYDKAINDYTEALHIDPFRTDLSKRIEEIQSILQRSHSPLPQSDPRIFRAHPRPPSPAMGATNPRPSPLSRRTQLSELG